MKWSAPHIVLLWACLVVVVVAFDNRIQVLEARVEALEAAHSVIPSGPNGTERPNEPRLDLPVKPRVR